MRFGYKEVDADTGDVLCDLTYTEQEAIREFGEEGFVYRYGGERPFVPGSVIVDEDVAGEVRGRSVSMTVTYTITEG